MGKFIKIVMIICFIFIFSCNKCFNPFQPPPHRPQPVLPSVDQYPVFHPSGKWIAYSHWNLILDTITIDTDIDTTDTAGIWIIKPDGSEQRLLFAVEYPYEDVPLNVDWSPDGDEIVFSWYKQIWKAEIDTMNMKIIPQTLKSLTNKDENFYPRWDPTGKRILWSKTYSENDDSIGIWIMDNEGNDKMQINKGVEAVWMDSNRIIFLEEGVAIKKIDLSTGIFSIILKTSEMGDISNINYSPQQSKIVFNISAGKEGIWICDTLGKNLKQLDNELLSIEPSFSPDGNKIVFIKNGNVWIMDIDGTNKKQLTFSKFKGGK